MDYGYLFFFLDDCIALIFLSFWMGLWVKGYTCCISYIACCFSIFFLTFRGNMKIMVQSICLWCFSTNNQEGESVVKEWYNLSSVLIDISPVLLYLKKFETLLTCLRWLMKVTP